MSIEDIGAMIDQAIISRCGAPKELNTSPFNLKDFRHCIMMDLIKDAYAECEQGASIRSHISKEGKYSDDMRVRYGRTLKYAQYYRNQQYENILETCGIPVDELLPSDMDTIEKKLSGHKVKPMQFFELQQMDEIPLLDAIIRKRICSTKKVGNQKFVEMVEDYDHHIKSLIDKLNRPDETLFATIALYTLEWKYSVELFYSCAVEAERTGYADAEIPVKKIVALCGDLSIMIPPTFTRKLYAESRFIKNRLSLVPAIYSGEDWAPYEGKIQSFLLLRYAVKQTISFNGESILRILQQTTTPADWAEYIAKHYDIRSIFASREWTNKRIRYMRRLYDALYRSIDPPKL